MLHVAHGGDVAGARELDVRVEQARGGAPERLLDAVGVARACEALDDDGVGAKLDDERAGVRGGSSGSTRRHLAGSSASRRARAGAGDGKRAGEEDARDRTRHGEVANLGARTGSRIAANLVEP